MLRTIWYLIKIVIIIGIIVFLASLQGSINISWQEYVVTIQLGLITAGLFITALIIFIISSIITKISLFPQTIIRARREKQRIKGYRSLLQGLTAAAIGDKKTALYMGKRAEKLLPHEESGLPLLLQAQAQHEDSKNNENLYLLLLQNADTALLGLQGMTQNAILNGDFAKALILVKKSVTTYPKNITLLKALYEMEIKNKHWSDALVTLKKAQKAKVIDQDYATSERRAIYLMLGDIALQNNQIDDAQKFYKLAIHENGELFTPVIMRMINIYKLNGDIKKAIKVLEKAWSKAPHPDIIKTWANLWHEIPEIQKTGLFSWIDKLAKIHPQLLISNLALADAAIENKLWGEARTALVAAEKICVCSDIYNLWIKLEEKSGGNSDTIKQWMDRYRTAEQNNCGSGAWVCTKTGRKFDNWIGIIQPEDLFNTLMWNDNIQTQKSISYLK